MRSVHLSALTVLALGALSSSAFAAQTFTFANPFANGTGSFSNSQFETFGIAPPAQPAVATLEAKPLSPKVNLIAIGGSTAGTYGATYSLTSTGGTAFTGVGNPSGTASTLQGGTLRFLSTAVTSFGPVGTVLLTYVFTPGALFGINGFGVAPSNGSNVVITGPLLDPTLGVVQQLQSKFSFSFPGSYSSASTPGALHFTAGFTSSVVQVVPEPASMGVLAIGAVALLRRRRRA